MFVSSLLDKDGSQCVLTYEEAGGWLRATWRGFVDPVEAQKGASQYLAYAEPFHCPYLLNDNLALQGPWFNAMEWLWEVWLPSAQGLGLRYVAHVVQADTHADILTRTFPEPLVGELNLQLFHAVAEAETWLRQCQEAEVARLLAA